MNRRLQAIHLAGQSSQLSDLIFGYVYATAMPEGSEEKDAISFHLRHKLLVAADNIRTVDEWHNQVNVVTRKILSDEDTTDAERKCLASVFALLAPFARRESLKLAADMITEMKQNVHEDQLYKGEWEVNAGTLFELATLAEARGQLELAGDLYERCQSMVREEQSTEMTRLSTLVDRMSERNMAQQVGETGSRQFSTLAEVAADLKLKAATTAPGPTID